MFMTRNQGRKSQMERPSFALLLHLGDVVFSRVSLIKFSTLWKSLNGLGSYYVAENGPKDFIHYYIALCRKSLHN